MTNTRNVDEIERKVAAAAIGASTLLYGCVMLAPISQPGSSLFDFAAPVTVVILGATMTWNLLSTPLAAAEPADVPKTCDDLAPQPIE